MAAQALYRKWRSQTFDEVIGQEHVVRTLRNALRDGRIAHAYLFTGPRGTGKTSTARLLAKAVNCLHEDIAARPDNTCPVCQAIMEGSLLDLIEIDAASNRGIDEIRDLRDKVHFAPSRARFKVYVIDEVHMLTPEAFNALLKTLEEPPAHVIFVLATTEPHKIPDTVLSRCQRFDFHRIPGDKIVDRLAYILEQEQRAAEPAALAMIARSADGSMRDAISLLDQLLSYGNEVITESQVQAVRGTISGQAIAALVDHMIAGEIASGLTIINQLAAEGVDLRQLTIQLVDHLRSVLLARVGGQQASALLVDLPAEQLVAVQKQAAKLDAATISRAIRLLNQAGIDMRDTARPQLALELAWLDALQPAAPPAVMSQPSPAAAQPASTAPPMSAAPAAVRPARQDVPSAPGRRQPPRPRGERHVLPKAVAPVPDEQVVETLRANWAALLQAAEAARGGSLRGALRTLRNVVAQGGDVYFAFEHEFAKDTVDRPANKNALQELISQLLGRPIRIHCQVGKQVTGVTQPAQASPAETVMREVSQDYDLENDPVVEHAQQHLGAVIKRP